MENIFNLENILGEAAVSEHVRDSGRVEASSGEDLLRGVPHPRGAEAGRERGGHGEGAQVGGGPAALLGNDSLPLILFRKQLKRRQSLQQQQQSGRDTSR